MKNKYNIIYADPPWRYNDRKNGKTKFGLGVHGHYPTMSYEEIYALNVASIAADNCALFLWCTFPYVLKQIEVFQSWGFKYKTVGFNWTKINKNGFFRPEDDPKYNPDTIYIFYPKTGLYHKVFFGVGYYAKSNTEVCLLGVKGRMKPVSNEVSSVLLSPRLKHSQKPAETRERIVDLFGDLPRVELFARQKCSGWDCWGNEIDSNFTMEKK